MINLIEKVYKANKSAKTLTDLERQQLHANLSTPIMNEIMDLVQNGIEEVIID